jgi:hypothetical protein
MSQLLLMLQSGTQLRSGKPIPLQQMVESSVSILCIRYFVELFFFWFIISKLAIVVGLNLDLAK